MTGFSAADEARLARANDAHRTGRLDDAERLYRELLVAHPGHADLHYRLGIVCGARGDFAAAAAVLQTATRLAPGEARAWMALGQELCELDRFDEGRAAFERAQRIDPAIPLVSARIGRILLMQHRFEEAAVRLAESVSREPRAAGLHTDLGLALAELGRTQDAIAEFVAAVRIDRGEIAAHRGIGELCQRAGDLPNAETAWREVLRLSPDNAAAHRRLGQALLTQWRTAQAEPLLRRACALDATDAIAGRALVRALKRLNRWQEAGALAQSALDANPADLHAAVAAKLMIPAIAASASEIAQARARYAAGLDWLEAHRDRFGADPGQALSLAWENFHLAYHGEDDSALQHRYAAFVAGLLRLAAPRHFAPKARRTIAPGERIRVGFVSSFFRDTVVAKYFASWVAGLDGARFERFVFHTGHVRDAVSESIARAVEHYVHTVDGAEALADRIAAARLDVLVHPEIGMDTAGGILAAMRLAPVQCAAWGHPVTTGHANVDYFFSCAAMEPEGCQAQYSERVVALPGLGTRYARPAGASARSRGELGLPPAAPLLLCPQSLFKIHPDNDALFARVLQAVPDACLVFFRDPQDAITAVFRERLRAAGIVGARVCILDRMGHADYLRVNALATAMLDTLRWSGGNTSLDAIAAGLPIVTLPGRTMRARQSFGMLSILGIPELVAHDAHDYVKIVARLVTDASWREGLRARIVEGSAALFDDPAPIAAVEEFLLSLFGAGR